MYITSDPVERAAAATFIQIFVGSEILKRKTDYDWNAHNFSAASNYK